MDKSSRARNVIFPILKTSEDSLKMAIQYDDVDHKMRKYVEISDLVGNILNSHGAYPTNMRNISGGRTRSELTRNMNKSIMNAYVESYINTKEIDNYEFGINTVIKNEITNNNRKLEDSEVISILNSSIKSSHSNYPIRDTIFNKRPTNCLEWLVLELLDRIRCDILKFKRL